MGSAIDTKRFEQMDGKLVERPWVNPRRSQIRAKAITLLAPRLAKLNLGSYVELPLKQSDAPKSDWMTPDITVNALARQAETKRGHLIAPVFLVIEILQEYESTNEMLAKAGRYLDWGVNYVWVILPHREFGLTFSQEHGKDPSMNWDYLIVPEGERAFWLEIPAVLAET